MSRITGAATVAMLLTSVGCAGGTSNLPATRLLELINQKRSEAGCQSVSGNDTLRVAAEQHVVDMRDHNAHLQIGTDGHTGTDGSRPEQRIVAAGYTPISRSGEILYYSTDPAANEATNVAWWMNSPPHRAVMLNCDFTDAGVGLVYPGGTRWYSVVDFGRH